MNSRIVSPVADQKTLPLVTAVALLAVCGVLFLKQQPGQMGDAARLSNEPFVKRPVSSDPPSASPVPGVLALPPATLEGRGPDTAGYSAQSSQQPAHRPPPDSRTAFSLADFKAQMPQRADGTFVIEVPTLHFSANDAAARQVMTGQPVETLAQIASHPFDAAETNRFRLNRLLTRCCSADARPYFIAATLSSLATKPASCTSGSWVKVRGRIAYERQPGGYGAVIAVESMTASTPPPNPVLH